MSHVESETESDSASQVQDQLEEEWDEWTGEDEEESDVTKSLFSNAMLPTPEAALEHDAATHGFDVRQYKIEVWHKRYIQSSMHRSLFICLPKHVSSFAHS